ncbi:hypothetical protein, partial [Paraburkholderia nodosa]|uniref:hypothetical protein n=1 Tax=Paraburkholderia nodosa TaxID=392320 RepID=UPI001C4020A3
KQGVVGSIPSSSTNPQCTAFCTKQNLLHWRLSQSERYVKAYRLSFFNNQEEVVKRFIQNTPGDGCGVGESGL